MRNPSCSKIVSLSAVMWTIAILSPAALRWGKKRERASERLFSLCAREREMQLYGNNWRNCRRRVFLLNNTSLERARHTAVCIMTQPLLLQLSSCIWRVLCKLPGSRIACVHCIKCDLLWTRAAAAMLSGDKTRVCIFQREQYISRRMHEMLVCVIGAMMMIMAIIIIVGSGWSLCKTRTWHCWDVCMYGVKSGAAAPLLFALWMRLRCRIASPLKCLAFFKSLSSAAVDWLIGRVVRNYDGSGMHAARTWIEGLSFYPWLSADEVYANFA